MPVTNWFFFFSILLSILGTKPGCKYYLFYFSIHHINFFGINLSDLKVPLWQKISYNFPLDIKAMLTKH